jgi:hypothetical protein
VKVFPTLLHQTYHQTREIALFSAYHHGELSQLIPPFNNLQQPLENIFWEALSLSQATISGRVPSS